MSIIITHWYILRTKSQISHEIGITRNKVYQYSHDLRHAFLHKHDIRIRLPCNLPHMIDTIDEWNYFPHRQIPIPFHLVPIPQINQWYGDVPCVYIRRVGVARKDTQLNGVELVNTNGSFRKGVKVGEQLFKDGVYLVIGRRRGEKLVVNLEDTIE
jgi:hypothetical protein